MLFPTSAEPLTVALLVTSFPSEATVWFKRLWNWLLTPSETPSAPPEAISCTACDELAARVSQLENQAADISALQLAWQETLDKLGRWASKQAARERRLRQALRDEITSTSSQLMARKTLRMPQERRTGTRRATVPGGPIGPLRRPSCGPEQQPYSGGNKCQQS